MVRLLFFIFWSFVFCNARGQEQVAVDDAEIAAEQVVVADTVDYEYWKARYYDSIPKATNLETPDPKNFEEMLTRYQQDEFEYAESVAVKLGFLDKLIDRFWKFIEMIFPKSDMELDKSVYKFLGVIGAIGFLFLLYKLLFTGKKLYVKLESDDPDEESTIDFVEKNLMEVSLEHYIQEAYAKQNFPLAIRYQQLLNIQILAKRDLIDWKQYKTNAELMEEINNGELRKDFQHCTSIFDAVWFGSFPIDASVYERYVTDFRQFQKRWA